MATKCLSLVRGRRYRVTRLDGCGRPVYGGESSGVMKGVVSVAVTANTTESDEINVQNSSGDVCVFEPAETTLNGYSLEIQFCEMDPDLFAMITGQEVYRDEDGNAVGFTIDTDVSLSNQGFALEIWLGAPSDGCSDGGQGSFGYVLYPFLRGGILGDYTIENGAVTFTITGASTRDGNAWGVGPYSDVMLNSGTPGPLVNPIKPTSANLTVLTEVAPPEAACGARPLLDPSLPDLTSVEGTSVDGQTFDFTVTPASTGPVWYDFGDGEWDYVVAPGDASHTYTEPGDYTVRASQNGVWVETTITVTTS